MQTQRTSASRPFLPQTPYLNASFGLDFFAHQSGTAVTAQPIRDDAFSSRTSGLSSVAGQFWFATLNGEYRMPQTLQTKSKPQSKKALLEQMLRRKSGADIAAISKKFGWQPHTVRAVLSGFRKAGLDVVRDAPSGDRPARYRIASVPGAQEPKASADAR